MIKASLNPSLNSLLNFDCQLLIILWSWKTNSKIFNPKQEESVLKTITLVLVLYLKVSLAMNSHIVPLLNVKALESQ